MLSPLSTGAWGPPSADSIAAAPAMRVTASQLSSTSSSYASEVPQTVFSFVDTPDSLYNGSVYSDISFDTAAAFTADQSCDKSGSETSDDEFSAFLTFDDEPPSTSEKLDSMPSTPIPETNQWMYNEEALFPRTSADSTYASASDCCSVTSSNTDFPTSSVYRSWENSPSMYVGSSGTNSPLFPSMDSVWTNDSLFNQSLFEFGNTRTLSDCDFGSNLSVVSALSIEGISRPQSPFEPNQTDCPETERLHNVYRSDPLYKNATVGPDGLYHCPFERTDPQCTHKADKLKCNYDKFVDSHLKPYRCKHRGCESTRFSSTACQLRHEREAHALHGHGEKPYLCTFQGCERAVAGNGFPRHWNMRDHMRRVHGVMESAPPSTDIAAAVVRKNLKRKAEGGSNRSTKRTTADARPDRRIFAKRDLSKKYENISQRLDQSVKSLSDPSHPEFAKRLQVASKWLQALEETGQKLKSETGVVDGHQEQTG